MRKWLRDERKGRKWSQKHIAELAGISRSYYTQIENGVKTPGVKVAQSIGKVLGISWTKFFVKRNGTEAPIMIRHVIDTCGQACDAGKWRWLSSQLLQMEERECLVIIEGKTYVVYPATEKDVERIVRSFK